MKRLILLLLTSVLLLTIKAAAVTRSETANYLLQAVRTPQYGMTGGEWAVVGIARGSSTVPRGWYDNYLKSITAHLRQSGGVLDTRKYTEYSRVILALTALGKNAANFSGYDLTAPLGDDSAVMRQGLNGAIWALLALDSGGYDNANRRKYVDAVVTRQRADGGWSLSETQAESDPDLTAMALQALAKYRWQNAVEPAVKAGLAYLSAVKFSTSESVSQTVIALCELGMQPDRYVEMLQLYADQSGGFRHTSTSGVDLMATEQALLALTAVERLRAGQTSLYRIRSAVFQDVIGHPNRAEIESLAERNILNGKAPWRFDPDASVTRAEFAAIVTRALALPEYSTASFTDVAASAWYAPYVGAACRAGIVTGRGGRVFDPNSSITRQEAAVMVARAAEKRGMTGTAALPDSLEDAALIAPWAVKSVALCYREGILSKRRMEPLRAIRRCEVAEMIYRLLEKSYVVETA